MSISGRVFAAMYDRMLASTEEAGLREHRRALVAKARGRVLEIGAGTGLNVEHYGPEATELVFTEPEEPMARRLRARVERGEVVEAPADELPFEDDSFDTVVSTLVLCTVPDLDRAIAEIRRVLKPDGRLLFLEHVRSSDPKTAKWQDRLMRPWRLIGHGCHCNRDTAATLTEAGFRLDIETWRMPKAPAIVRPVIEGAANIARLTLATVLLVLALVAPATAAPDFQGITGQDHLVTISVDDRGVPQGVDITWETRRCWNLPTRIKGIYNTWVTSTSGLRLARATRRRLSGVSRLTGVLSENRTMTSTARVTGRRRGKRWVGTIRARVVFRRRGRVLEVCGMRPSRWRADRHRASLTLTGDVGDWVSLGNSYAADHRSHDVRAWSSLGDLAIEWIANDDGEPSFGARFSVGRPRAGRTYKGHDAADVSGDARGCGSDVQTGALKVERVRLDRKGRVRLLVATYEQRCDAKYPKAHRGRVTFRRGW